MTSPQWLGISLGLAVMGALVASPALAHNQVLTLTPEPDSIVSESPVAISIYTSDQLLDLGGEGRGFAIAVTDESGLYYGDGCVMVDATSMSASVPLGEQGLYTIIYQYVSADGHGLSDLYSFRFEPGESHIPSQGFQKAPVCGEEPAQVEAEPILIAAPKQAHEPNIGLIVAGIGVAVLATAVLLTMLKRRGASRA
jgi:methionine-rich copper-binding protein CopC